MDLQVEQKSCRTRRMKRQLGTITYLVRDYDEAIEFFTEKLGFKLIEDTALGDGKRWVLVSPQGAAGTDLLLAKAVTPDQIVRIGDQAGGRVFLFLHTDDFRRDYDAMQSRGVSFLEAPRKESYGTVAVFEDLYGNKWDLLQPAT
jgi:catechol 2,3-dioxygenase-like lactoylglutathione lyase family enzyme